jgi:hypothetical protein
MCAAPKGVKLRVRILPIQTMCLSTPEIREVDIVALREPFIGEWAPREAGHSHNT